LVGKRGRAGTSGITQRTAQPPGPAALSAPRSVIEQRVCSLCCVVCGSLLFVFLFWILQLHMRETRLHAVYEHYMIENAFKIETNEHYKPEL